MPSSDEPFFQTIAIAGLGLIGGSIALAVRERWPSIRIIGVDHPSVLAHATGSGAIDRSVASVRDLDAPDLIILAAPVHQNIQLLNDLASIRAGLGRAIVTDVGGTKRDIVEAARNLRPSFAFVGGHPIGGAERGGFGFARPDLFAGRPWIFTPDPTTPPQAVATLERFAGGIGARTTRLDAPEHDRLMAYLSHLPQLAASAVMEVVGREAGTGFRLAGRGLVDTTRLASSPASVWKDICASNADTIGQALDLLIDRLTALRADLTRGEKIEAIFDDAAHWRAELMKGRD